MKYTHIALALLLASVTVLTGCLTQPHPRQNSFVLNVQPPETRMPAHRRTLLVGTVSAAAGNDNRALVYRIGPDQFDTDFYNGFLAPPARLLADQTTQYLDAANRRVRVVRMPGLTLAEFGLETYLEAMYGDYTVEPPQAVLAIRFTVNDLRRTPTRVLLDRTYRHEAVITAKTPEGQVAALNSALAHILAELNSDIEKIIR